MAFNDSPIPNPQSLIPNRIAVLSVHTCPLAMLGGKKTGGMNVYVRDFCRELATRGVAIDVFTRSQDDCAPKIVHELGENARVIHIAAGPEVPLIPNDVAEYTPQFIDGVLAFAEENSLTYDLIHSHYWISGLVAEGLNQAWGGEIPIVQMFHTLGHMKNEIATNPSQRAIPERIAGETHVIHNVADILIAATPAEDDQLKKYYDADPQKIRVIPPGVDPKRFTRISRAEAKEFLGLDPNLKNVLLAARIEPLKGIDTLLRAVALVGECCQDTLANTTVTIIGGDPWADDLAPEMARLQQMRTDLGIEHLVTFIGSKDQNTLAYYYAAAEMVVMPSHYESFGLVALEAMSMGTPVLASEVGGLAHLVQDGVTGFHIPSGDEKALSERIYQLLDDINLRRKLGGQAQAYATRYQWTCIVDGMLQIYGEAMNGTMTDKRIEFPFSV